MLTRRMLSHTLIPGLGSVAAAMLNSRRQFLRPAVSIAIYDLGLIGGLLVSAIQLVGIPIPDLGKQGVQYSFLWNLKQPGLHKVLDLLIPNVIAVGIGSTGAIADTAIASYLPVQATINRHRIYLHAF